MNSSFFQNLSFQFQLSPHLLHSINLLRCSARDVEKELFKEAELNPFLEVYSKKRPLDEEIQFEVADEKCSLEDHLARQISANSLSKSLKTAFEVIVSALDYRGYLLTSQNELCREFQCEEKDFCSALLLLQSLDPPGLGAVSLCECLLLQLRSLSKEDSLSGIIIREFKEELEKGSIGEIARRTGNSEKEVTEAIAELARLDPEPASRFRVMTAEHIVPELRFFKNQSGKIDVSLVEENLPHCQLLEESTLIANSRDVLEIKRLRSYEMSARQLVASIAKRHETMLKVGRVIAARQEDYLLAEKSYMNPLTRREVCTLIDLHESTVGRAVKNKFAQTPIGVMELSDFFPLYGRSRVSAVKNYIAEILESEDPFSPLSDRQIVKALRLRGIVIARRTVAKYRNELGIPNYLLRGYE